MSDPDFRMAVDGFRFTGKNGEITHNDRIIHLASGDFVLGRPGYITPQNGFHLNSGINGLGFAHGEATHVDLAGIEVAS